MGAFVGPLGGLVECLHSQQSQSITQGSDPTFFEAINSVRTAQVKPIAGRVLREWSVSQDSARPEQAAALHAMCLGAMGLGPFAFVDPLAQWNNALTPRQSLLDPATLPSGTAPTRTIVPGYGAMPAATTTQGAVARFGVGTPVLPGKPVTVSAWVASAQSVTVTAQCLTASGIWTNNTSKVFSGIAGGGWVAVTVTPEAGSAQVDLRVTSGNVDTLACPAITWTPRSAPWSVGRGASSIVLSGFSEGYERTGTLDGQRRISYSATVTEVGSGA